METDSYSANQRRAINLVWTACGDYQFEPQFLALNRPGELVITVPNVLPDTDELGTDFRQQFLDGVTDRISVNVRRWFTHG